jgi:undecaprenyl diphosphate synthase
MFKVLYSPKAEVSWQEMMLSASQIAFRDAYKNNDDNASLLMALHCPDNFASETCTCTEDSYAQLLLKILRWVKLLILKLAASYYALPLVLALLPLTLGLLIGYSVGSRQFQKRHTKAEEIRNYVRTSGTWLKHYIRSIPWSMATFCIGLFPSPNTTAHEHAHANSCSNKITTDPSPQESTLPPILSAETEQEMRDREEKARRALQSDTETLCESGLDLDQIPKHIAIIMDGNRRFGKQQYGNATSGHWDGSKKVLEVAKWCTAEQVKVLTVFAFSTENWRRDPTEVASLMAIFTKYCEELRVEAIDRNIRVRILSTDDAQVPAYVKASFDRLQDDTSHCEGGLEMNICLSYGGRGEIVNACRQLALDCVAGHRSADSISENDVQSALLTKHTCDPDILIRTSGEERISNFLLWQLAYTELFFLECHWPEFSKKNLLDVMQSYAQGRRRRFGK